MDFRYLKAFMAAAEQSSFSKAADELNIAQSAVSRQVKLLEESIQDELLIRSSKHLTLTPKGLRLFEAIKRFQNESAALLADGERSLIRVGILHGLLENWFQGLLGEYYHKHDDNFHLTVGNLHELKEGLETGRFEIVFLPQSIDSELVVSRPLFDEELALVSKDVLDPARLADYRWIIYGPEDLLLRYTRLVPRRVVQVNSITAMLKLVKQGVGIAVLPDHMVKNERGLELFRDLKIPAQTIFVSHLRFRKTPAALEALLKMLPQ